jgi:hypothetical protein
MPVFPAVYSLVQDPNDPSGQTYRLVVNIDPQYIPNLSAELDVENGLVDASQQYPAFTGMADLGVATVGVYAMFLSFVAAGRGTSSATIVISNDTGSLSIIVATPVAATAGAIGFDTYPPLTPATIGIASTPNDVFCLRYVSRQNTTTHPSNITSAEVATLLKNSQNIALMLVQHATKVALSPSATLGTTCGVGAVTNAGYAGIAKGVTIFCDLENIAPGAAASDVIDYCNNWAAAVSAAGYVPGLYVGANCGFPLGAQLPALNFTIYWESCSNVPTVAQGYCMSQYPCSVPRGTAPNVVTVDVDTISASPGSLTWLMRQPSAAISQVSHSEKRKRSALTSTTRTPVVHRRTKRR